MTTRKVKQPAHIKVRAKETPYSAYKKEINRLLVKSQTGGGWGVYFTCSKDLGIGSAQCSYDRMGRWVEFAFSNKNSTTIADAKISAKHEFAHFVTGRLDILARDRFVMDYEINEEMELVANILQRLI